MENNKNIRMIRGIGYYLPKALKFYNLKSEYITPLVFSLTLGFYFICNYFLNKMLPDVMGTLNDFVSMSNKQMPTISNYGKLMQSLMNSSFISFIINVINNFFIGIITSIFLMACIKELKNDVFTLKDGLSLLSKKFLKIAILSFIFSFLYNFLKMFLVFPAFIYYSVYLFYLCYALDLKKNVAGAFEASKEMTKGHRIEIFSVVILFKIVAFISVYIITVLILSIITSILNSTGNYLVEIFVSAFMSSITYLMGVKLVALIYHDIEYGWTVKKD